MATLGEFGSLLQLGAGIGIGLSVFRAPVDLRVASIAKVIDNELDVIRGLDTERANQIRGRLASLKLKFSDEREWLDTFQKPFMVVTVILAITNWLGLIAASFYAQRDLSEFEQWALVCVSVGAYVAIVVILEGVARWRLGFVSREISAVRGCHR